MARTRFFDYEMEDLTDYLNRRYRGVLQPGVYLGYNAQKGTGNMDVSLIQDTDLDISGAKLGTIITRDGIVIQETADLTDVATAANGHAVHPRVDYLVADYTFNASLPNNDVSYSIVAGTPATPPLPPTLGDDQLALAELYIPALFVGPIVNGTNIIDVNRKNLYASSQINLEDILRNGVYAGLFLERGTAANKLDISAGTLLTREEKRITEAADLADEFTLTDTTGATWYRYDVVVCLHKYEDLESNPHEYLVVEGTEQDESIGSTAVLPTDAQIGAAVQAHDAKYGGYPGNIDYWTKLGYVRAQGIGAAMVVEYHQYQRMLHGLSFYVSAGKITDVTSAADYNLGPNTQIWPFTGHEGFASALTVIQKLVEAYYSYAKDFYANDQPIKLWAEGDFHIPAGVYHGIPSYVVVEGLGSTVFRYPVDATVPFTMMLGGWGEGAMATAGATFSDKHTNQVDMPAGFHRYEFFVQHANDQAPWGSLPNGLDDFNFSGHGLGIGNHPTQTHVGDPVVLRQGANEFVGWFEQYVTDEVNATVDTPWTFRAIVPDTFVENTIVESCYIGKRRNGLKNIKIVQTGTQLATTHGALDIVGCHDAVIDQVRAPHVVAGFHKRCSIGRLEITDYIWDSSDCTALLAAPDELAAYGNKYENLIFRSALAFGLAINFGGSTDLTYKNEFDSWVGKFDVDSGEVSDTLLLLRNSIIGLFINKGVSGNPELYLEDCSIGECTADSSLSVYGSNSSYGGMDLGAVNLVWEAGSVENVLGHLTAAAITDNTAGATAHRNYTVYAGLKAYDEDRNLVVGGDAVWAWNSTTGILTWDADTDIECPYFNGDNTILAASSPSAVIADGSFLVVQLVRDTNVAVAPSVVTAANRPTIRNQDYFVVAARFGTTLHFFDGTKLATGSSTRLGEATAPDDSITWEKYAASGKAYVNDSFRHWFDHNDAYAEDNQLIVDVSALMAAASYTAATGVVQFGAAADLSNVEAGDTFLDDDGDRFWILAVNDGADNLTLHQGLDITTRGAIGGGATYGVIVRGNAIYRNTNFAANTFNWAQTGVHTGTVTYAGAIDTTGIKIGYLFRDCLGNLFPIVGVAAASVDIENVYTLPSCSNTGGTVDDELDGSVQTNNNPRDINLYDMKPGFGYEVVSVADLIHFEMTGNPEPRIDKNSDSVYATVTPYDKRIRVYSDHLLSRASTGEQGAWIRDGVVNDSSANILIEVTAWMTGIAFVTSGDHEFDTGETRLIYVDGELVDTIAFDTHWTSNDQVVTGVEAPCAGPCGWWVGSPFRSKKLSPGIHTVRVNAKTAVNVRYSAIVILNESNPISGEYFEIPGTLYGDQGKHAVSTMKKDVALPALGDRGGKLIRYLQSSDHTTRSWAHTELDTPVAGSITGDTGAGVTVTDIKIGGVPSTTGLKLGDMIRLVYVAPDPPEKRVITAINPGVSIDVNVAPTPGAKNDVVIHWVGRTIAGLVATEVCELTRDQEQVAMVIPWYAFGTYAVVGPNEECSNVAQTDRAVCGGDLHHFLYSKSNDTPIATNYRDELTGTVAGDEVRFGFVGTGIDLLVFPDLATVLVTVYVDGVSLGNLDLGYSSSLNISGRVGAAIQSVCRFPLCFDMEYGSHEVCIVAVVEIHAKGFVVYDVKDPTYNGYPTFSTNYCAQNVITDIGGGDLQTDQLITEVRAMPSNLLRLPGESVSGIKGAVSAIAIDPGYGFSLDVDSIGGRSYLHGALDSVQVSRSYITFYGNAVSVDFLNQNNAGGVISITPEFIDHDGVARAPAAFLGTTITGVTGAQALAAGAVDRYTWTLGFESLWTLRLTFTANVAEELNILGVHTGRLFHQTQRRETISGHSFLQPTPAGRDIRSVKAYDIVPTDAIRFMMRKTAVVTVGTGIGHIKYYSRGEFVDIKCFGHVEDSAVWDNDTIKIRIRGRSHELALIECDNIVNNRILFSLGGSIYLPEGHHIINVDFGQYATMTDLHLYLTASPVKRSFDREEIKKATPDLVSDEIRGRRLQDRP